MIELFQKRKKLFTSLLHLTILFALPNLMLAGGYLLVSKRGVVYKWDTSKPIPQHIDGGNFGILVGAAAANFVEDAILVWTDEPSLSINFALSTGTLVPDGDVNTLSEFLTVAAAGNGKSPVIMDDDGAILAALGVPPGVVGMTFIKKQDDLKHQIVETLQLFNGQLIDGNPNNGELPLHEMAKAITHEMGHALNFDHTQVNGHYFIGDVDDPGFVKYGAPPAGAGVVNLMFPFAIGDDNIAETPNRDDLATAEFLYGNASAASGVISGHVFAADASTPMQGANLIARNSADPFFDAVSSVSGYLYWPSGPGGGPASASLKGKYDVRGLTPGTHYTVEKVRIHHTFRFGSSVGPLNVPIYFDVEEFYNGSDESANGATDRPDAFVTVPASATGIDFIANEIAGKIELDDDDVAEIALPFAFPFYGQTYHSVFVHANGFLTFGSPSDESLLGAFESISDLLSAPPRIAPLWDDLNPSSAGTVTALADGADFVITFTEVPEYAPAFGAGGANTFSVRLRPDGSFRFEYGMLSALDGLAGISPGAAATDPGESDLSHLPQPIRAAAQTDAVYQAFNPLLGTANDLANLSLEFAPHTFSLPITIAPAVTGVCYAGTGAVGNTAGLLLTINPVNGTGDRIGGSGLAGIADLAINSLGQIFGVSSHAGGSNLFRMSATTSYAETIAPLTATPTSLGAFEAIAFNHSDVLFGIDSDNALYTINTTTGAISKVGETDVSPSADGIFAGLAFQPNTGKLFGTLKKGSQGALAGALYEIDPATGAVTLVGNTGFGNGIEALFFVDGALYGSATLDAQPDAISHLVRLDLEGGAGTVIGAIGFPAVHGLACFGAESMPVLEYVLLATGDIKIAGNATSEGKMHSNRSIHFDKGAPGVHTGDLSAVDRISIGKNNEIRGAVTTGASLFLDGHVVITGTITENADISPVTVPEPDFSSGLADKTAAKKGRLDLQPGTYGKVKVEKRGTVHLKSGTYFVRELDTDRHSKVVIDVTAGPVHVYATHELDFDDGVTVEIVPSGENGTRLVSFTTLQSHKVDVGKSALVLGTISAPKAKVLLSKGSVFKGAIYAQSINVQKAVPFFHHDAVQPLPKPAPLPEEAEQLLETIADRYYLEQNYPNPFNPMTTISYQLSAASEVELGIFDRMGREVLTLVQQRQPAGSHRVSWDGRDRQGKKVASGLYWYRLRAGEFVLTRKMVLTK